MGIFVLALVYLLGIFCIVHAGTVETAIAASEEVLEREYGLAGFEKYLQSPGGILRKVCLAGYITLGYIFTFPLVRLVFNAEDKSGYFLMTYMVLSYISCIYNHMTFINDQLSAGDSFIFWFSLISMGCILLMYLLPLLFSCHTFLFSTGFWIGITISEKACVYCSIFMLSFLYTFIKSPGELKDHLISTLMMDTIYTISSIWQYIISLFIENNIFIKYLLGVEVSYLIVFYFIGHYNHFCKLYLLTVLKLQRRANIIIFPFSRQQVLDLSSLQSERRAHSLPDINISDTEAMAKCDPLMRKAQSLTINYYNSSRTMSQLVKKNDHDLNEEFYILNARLQMIIKVVDDGLFYSLWALLIYLMKYKFFPYTEKRRSLLTIALVSVIEPFFLTFITECIKESAMLLYCAFFKRFTWNTLKWYFSEPFTFIYVLISFIFIVLNVLYTY